MFCEAKALCLNVKVSIGGKKQVCCSRLLQLASLADRVWPLLLKLVTKGEKKKEQKNSGTNMDITKRQ